MSDDRPAPASCGSVCLRPAHCPVCGEPNRCRLETGEPYKGSCWCERPVLTSAALNRLFEELLEPRCLCRCCLETVAANPEVTWEQLAARDRTPETLPVRRLLPASSALKT